MRHCAPNRRTVCSILGGVIPIFHWRNYSDCTATLESTHPPTEMGQSRPTILPRLFGSYEILKLRRPVHATIALHIDAKLRTHRLTYRATKQPTNKPEMLKRTHTFLKDRLASLAPVRYSC